MKTPVVLPVLGWGSASASRRALLVHGLGSSGALMWRIGTALAEAGWLAYAVDLRGHGTAPRALDYTISAYAADLAELRPDGGGAWDAVIGHSLGGAASVVAAATVSGWTERLLLIDPAIELTDQQRAQIQADERAQFADPSPAAIRAAHPHWHPTDLELKVQAVAQASAFAVEQTMVQNREWDVRGAALTLDVPVHIIAGDPAVFALFQGAVADQLLTHPSITMSVIEGAGHSPHRDRPEETIAQVREVLS